MLDLLNPLVEEADIDELLAHPPAKYLPLEFESPSEFGAYFHAAIESGDVKLYDWQLWASELLSRPGWSKQDALRLLISAANGSGKDAYVIALAAVWLTACNIRSRCIITSASHSQLSSQTEAYIRNLCFAVNDKLATKVFVVKKQHIYCNLTGSEIKLFATDDPGKAEGYHPFPDYPNGKLMLVVNEAKSVGNEIFTALCRCTYTHFLLISSPGKTSGFFYHNALAATDYNKPALPGGWVYRRVTAFDCPHISTQKIEALKREYGENSPLYRSSILAEFTSLDETVVVQQELIRTRLSSPPPIREFKKELGAPVRAGADFGAGGDESVSYVIQGNRVLGRLNYSTKDQVQSANHLANFWNSFKSQGLKPENIHGDDGGIGRGTMDILARLGWPINRVLNQSAPAFRLNYGNRGAELWFMLARLLEEDVLILPSDDPLLHTQLANRYYKKLDAQGRVLLESKAEAKRKGHGSPDRADAYCLAYTGVTPEDFDGWLGVGTLPVVVTPKGVDSTNLAEWYKKTYTFARGNQQEGEPEGEARSVNSFFLTKQDDDFVIDI